MDLIDKTHCIHLRLYRELLVENGGVLDVDIPGFNSRNSLIIDHKLDYIKQTDNVIRLKPYFGEREKEDELDKLANFLEKGSNRFRIDLRRVVVNFEETHKKRKADKK